jgi:hypothetical protein
MERIWRGKLQKLCRLRFGNHFLPDDDDGRAMLTALLRFGVTDENAMEDAPWCSDELPTLKRRARRMKWREVGKLIELTFEEWKHAKLWIMQPIDASELDIQAWRKERDKESSRKSKAKARAKEKQEKDAMLERANAKMETTNPRQDAILEIMIERGGLSSIAVPELMNEARKLPAFTRSQCRNTRWVGGPPASAIVSNLRDAVHETLNQLERKGVVKTYKRPGERGPVRHAELEHSLIWPKARDDEHSFIFDAENERRNVGPDNWAKHKQNQ